MSGAVEYLFNCLSHPGTCTKADQPEIRRAAAACGNNDYACIRRIAIYARESGIPLPPDIAQSLLDFADITTLPARVFTPAGRVADDLIDAVKFVTGSDTEQIGIASGWAYEKAMERITHGLNVPAVTEAWSKIWGKIFESITQSAAEEAAKKPK